MNDRLILRTLSTPFLPPYDDITKSSVLSHSDLDNNFIYLKGNIIYTAETNGNVVTLKKHNNNNLSFIVDTEIHTTGITFNNNSYILNIKDNLGISYAADLSILASDMTITGGTYNIANGSATFTNNTGGTFVVTGFLTGMTDTYTTGGTYTSGNVLFTNNTGGTFTVSGFNTSVSPIGIVNSTSLFSTGLTNTGINASGVTDSIFFGVSAGYNASGSSNSNFIGYQAGRFATNANNSNFLGNSAGVNAVNAYQSNFFGIAAGISAFNAYQSNFLGQQAGKNANSANNSNFLGYYAGSDAINANNSNFMGVHAGSGATNAYQSNFLGQQAGSGATNASYSNFLGYQAGANASGATNSNFIGIGAGYGAINAVRSNFLGTSAGGFTLNTYDSNFLGYGSGNQAINANNSNFMGYGSGSGATNASYSNFFGYVAGANAINANNSNFFGGSAGFGATGAYASNFLGSQAGANATDAYGSNFIGSFAGYSASSAYYSNFMGANAGYIAINANNSNFFGQQAGENATNASNSNFLGNGAGISAINAANSIFIGRYAGSGDTVNNAASYDDITTFANTSILLGHKTSTNGYSNSIALGAYAINTSSNQLVVGSTQRPISGLTIANVAYKLPISQGGSNTYLKNDGSGNLTWTTNAVVTITGGTYTAGTTTFTNNTGGTINVTGYYTGTTNLGNILFVSPYGNDSSGVRGYIDKPYLTLKGARDAASSGDTIHVFPQTIIFDNRNTNSNFWNGKQADINLWKNGVTYFFEPNCKIKFYNQTVSGQELYLVNPTTTTGETCTILGHLEYEQYGTGVDTSNGHNRFYYDTSVNAHTFYAQIKSLYSNHCDYLHINRLAGGATAETNISIITDTESRTYVAGQSGTGAAVFIAGTSGAIDDSFLNLTLQSRYREINNAFPFYVVGNLNNSKLNITGDNCVIKNQGNLFVGSKLILNYNVNKTYYTRHQSGNLWYGSFMSTSQLNNSIINIKGDLIDNMPNTETHGVFHVGSISNNNTINFDGNITTKTNSGIGRFIALTDGVVSGNTINIKGDINYIGTGVTTQYMFRTNGDTGNTINYSGKINGNFAAPIANCYKGNININNSTIKSTIDGASSSIGLNGSTSLGSIKVNNSYIELKNSTNAISNGSYVNQYINNSTIINTAGSGLSNTTSFGFLQTLNSTIITTGTSINYTSTASVISSNSVTNNTYNINTLYGDISTITEITF